MAILDTVKENIRNARQKIYDSRSQMSGKPGGYLGAKSPAETTADAAGPMGLGIRAKVQARVGGSSVAPRMISEYRRDAAPTQVDVPATRARLISA